MITVSSGWITIQAVISGAPIARAACAPNGTSKPSASPPPAAATLTRKLAAIDPPRVRHRCSRQAFAAA